jgi:hypothetical protein
MWVAFLVGALHGVGLCPVKTSSSLENLGDVLHRPHLPLTPSDAAFTSTHPERG